MAAVIRSPDDDTELRTVLEFALPIFCDFGAPPPTPAPPVEVTGRVATADGSNDDTVRGGKTVWFIVDSSNVADPSADQSFVRLTSLPAAWTASGPGSAIFDAKGVILSSGRASNSSETLRRSDLIYFFDAAIDIDVLQPKGLAEGVVETATFFYESVTTELTITVERDAHLGYLARAQATAFGRTIVGQAFLAPSTRLTLRLVRHDRYAYAFIGTREADRSYSTLIKLLEMDQFGVDSGRLSFGVANGTRAIDVRTRFSNFTIESHARVGPRLIENKRVIFDRIVGEVPAATIQEIGFTDVAMFGLFGEAVEIDGFEYTLPPVLTIGRAKDRQLVTAQDKILKDGT